MNTVQKSDLKLPKLTDVPETFLTVDNSALKDAKPVSAYVKDSNIISNSCPISYMRYFFLQNNMR